MIVRATQKYVRQTPRKLRLVADLVRGRALPEVNDILSTLNKRGARVINETIRQAVANAVNNLNLDEETLRLKTIMINEGPTYKRFRAGARGRAKPYEKKTSHVLVELEAVQSKAAQPAKQAKAASQAAEKSAEAVSETTQAAETKKPAKKTSKKASATPTTDSKKKAPAKKAAKKSTAATAEAKTSKGTKKSK